MRNKTMRRGLAWILSAATIMTSVPVSAEEIVMDTGVVSEENGVVEENLDAGSDMDAVQPEKDQADEEILADEEEIISQADASEEGEVLIENEEESTDSADAQASEQIADEENADLIALQDAFDGASSEILAPTSSVETLEEGTYNVCANIVVWPQDNQVLKDKTVYMTGPKFPPIVPRYEKKATLTVEENGDTYVTIPLDNGPASIFTLQEISSGPDCELVDTTRDEETYGELTGRITEVKVKLGNLSGQYTFGECKEYPTLFKTFVDMPLHLHIDLANADKVNNEEEKNLTLEDEESGAVLQLTAENASALKAYKGASFRLKEVSDESILSAVNEKLQDQYVQLSDHEEYEIEILDANGQALSIGENVTAQMTFTPSFGATESGVCIYYAEGELKKESSVVVNGQKVTTNISATGAITVINESNSKPWAEISFKDSETNAEMDFHYGVTDGMVWENGQFQVKSSEDGTKYWLNTMLEYYGMSLPLAVWSDKDYAIVRMPVTSANAKVFLVDQETAKDLKATIKDGIAEFTLFAGGTSGDYVTNGNLVSRLNASYTNQSTDSTSAYLLVTEEKIAAEPTVKSYTYNGKEQTGVTLDDSLTLVSGTTKATEAGTYTAVVKPAEGYSWVGGSEEEKIYTWRIGQKVLESVTYSYLPYNYTDDSYTGTLPTLESIIAGLNFTGFVEGEDASSIETKPDKLLRGTLPTKEEQLKPGTYTYSLTGGSAKNYSLSAKHIVVVGITPETEQSLTTVKTDLTYTGAGQYPLSATDNHFVLKNKNGKTVSVSAFKDAGNYEGYTLQPTEYYSSFGAWSDGSTDAKTLNTIEIKKAMLTAKVEDQTIAVYDGTQKINVSVDGLVAGETTETAKKYVAPTASLPETVEPNTTYTVTAEGGSAKNYDFTYTEGQITVGKVAVDRPLAIDSISYNGEEITGVIADGTGYTVEGIIKATNVGTYTATIKLKDGYVWNEEEYPDDEMTVTWQITPATASMPQAVSGLFYNGTAQTGVTATTGVVFTGVTKAANAGTYTATAIPTDNYVWEDGTTTSKTITWSIAKKGVVAPSAANGLVYNGAAQTGVAAGKGYILSGNAVATDAGSYTAVATLDSNHSWTDGSNRALTLTWSIAKADQSVNVATANKTYKLASLNKKSAAFSIGATTAGTVSYKVTAAPKKGAKYITVNASGKVTMKKKAPAGTYQVMVSAAATANQNAGTKVVTITVAKDKQKLTAKLSKKTVKVNSVKKKAAKITIKAKATGKLSYKVVGTPAGAGKYITVSKKGKVTLKKGAPKGTYQIRVTAKETSKLAKAEKTVNIVVK